tara:strand:+ start:254 stop:568 length:315 start_codon:yes stop_codon:yes gene_type:complete
MNKNYFFLAVLFLLSSCQNVKDALSGKKYENSDEFLVIKKNPLVLPPNFNELPTPKDVVDNTQIENIENEIEDLLSSVKDNNEKVVESSASSATESFVLEKIKD